MVTCRYSRMRELQWEQYWQPPEEGEGGTFDVFVLKTKTKFRTFSFAQGAKCLNQKHLDSDRGLATVVNSGTQRACFRHGVNYIFIINKRFTQNKIRVGTLFRDWEGLNFAESMSMHTI